MTVSKKLIMLTTIETCFKNLRAERGGTKNIYVLELQVVHVPTSRLVHLFLNCINHFILITDSYVKLFYPKQSLNLTNADGLLLPTITIVSILFHIKFRISYRRQDLIYVSGTK